MRNLLIVFVAALSIAGCRAEAQGQTAGQTAGQTSSVSGHVVDLVCYARNNANTGMDHDDGRACAIACVKWEGNPVGIVATDGKVYQFTGGLTANNNARIAAHLAHSVTVTGKVSEKDGMLMLAADEVVMNK